MLWIPPGFPHGSLALEDGTELLYKRTDFYAPEHEPAPLWSDPGAEKLIPLFVGHLLLGRPLPIYGDGLNVRDWLHVKDHVRGVGAALDRGEPGATYHLGRGVAAPSWT